jgi:outer membrane protein, heavy metal efflux system
MKAKKLIRLLIAMPLCFLGGVALLVPHARILAATHIFTLNEVLALAQRNPTILAAQSQREAATAALQTARAYPNPLVESLSGRSTARHLGAVSGSNARIGVAQPIELPSVRASRAQRALAGIEVANAASERVGLEVQAEVKQAFYEILRRQTEAGIAAHNQALLAQIQERVKLRVETGEAPRYELIKAEAELLNAVKNRERAEMRINEAESILRGLIGSGLPLDFDVEGALPELAALPPIEKLRLIALEVHPIIAFNQALLQQAEAQLQLERNLRYPQPTLRAEFERDPDLDQWRLGISLPLPLWNRRQGPIAEAIAELGRREATAEQQRLVLIRELENAYTYYQIAVRQEEAFETGLLREAEAALKVAETAYRQGARGILDYLDAQRTFQAVRQDYINTLFDKQAAYIEIERLLARGDGESQ